MSLMSCDRLPGGSHIRAPSPPPCACVQREGGGGAWYAASSQEACTALLLAAAVVTATAKSVLPHKYCLTLRAEQYAGAGSHCYIGMIHMCSTFLAGITIDKPYSVRTSLHNAQQTQSGTVLAQHSSAQDSTPHHSTEPHQAVHQSLSWVLTVWVCCRYKGQWIRGCLPPIPSNGGIPSRVGNLVASKV